MGLLTIDPGINGCGVASFIDERLAYATYVKNPCPKDSPMPERVAKMVNAVVGCVIRGTLDSVVVEVPQIYTRTKSKGDPNDLIPLAGISYGLAAAFYAREGVIAHQYLPREWKGNVDADLMIERIKGRLSPAELAVCTGPTYLLHNVYDAVGIGLKYLGRLEPKRVISRGSRPGPVFPIDD